MEVKSEMACSVRTDDGFTRYGRRFSDLPIRQGFVVEGSFQDLNDEGGNE